MTPGKGVLRQKNKIQSYFWRKQKSAVYYKIYIIERNKAKGNYHIYQRWLKA